jgi:thiamine transport system ATP-binding protein
MVPRLSVHELVVELDGVTVLDGIDLSVDAGATVSVLGPSGGGKSTLLRAIAGLLDVRSGRIELDGADLAGVPTHRRGLGLMFQDLALFPHRDVGQNVAFGLVMSGLRGAQVARRVDEVLELVGLTGLSRRPVASLSGGQAQRVALARSLAPAPGVLLLDEPLTSLDRPLHDHLAVELNRVVRSVGQTVVHVTHDRSEALAHADLLIVLIDGRIVQHDSPAEVWRRPASAEVARFLGQSVIDVVVDGERLVPAGSSTPGGRCGVGPAGGDQSGALAEVTDWPPGPARIAVPPEAVRLVGPADEGVGALVESSSFAGSSSRVQVALADGQELATAQPGPPPPTGGRVRVRIDPGSLTVLPGS